MAAVLWGCYLLKTGQTDITSFLAFSMYIASINMTFLVIATVWTFIKDFQGRATRIARLIEAPTELTGKKAAGAQDVPPEICVSRVWLPLSVKWRLDFERY